MILYSSQMFRVHFHQEDYFNNLLPKFLQLLCDKQNNCIFISYMPSARYVEHWQIAQTQITRGHRMRRLIRVSTVCLHNFLLKLEYKLKIPPNIPYNRNGLFQLITMGNFILHKWVKCCSHKMNKHFTCEIYIRNQSVFQCLFLALC